MLKPCTAKFHLESSCLHRAASIVSKILFIIPTDAQYYKSAEMLKQFKSYNNCPDMFRFMQEPSSGQYAATELTEFISTSTEENHSCSFSQAQDCSLMMVLA
jgi:hypothetical protein